MTLKPPVGPNVPEVWSTFEDRLDDTETNVSVVKEAPLNIAYPEYGAAVDGTTDDTAAWTAAIAALPAYSGGVGGGEILVPPGITRVTSAITLPHDGVTIRGVSGRRASVIRGSIAGPVITSVNDGSTITNYTKLENLFVLNQSANTAARAVEIYLCNVVDVDNCTFQADGQYSARLRYCYNVTLERSNFNGTGPDAALILDGNPNANTATRLHACSFRDAKAGLVALATRGLTVQACHFEGLAGSAPLYNGAISGSALFGAQITGNYFESCNQAAFQLLSNLGNNRGLVIGGNFITNCGNPGISSANVFHSDFLPNFFWPGAISPNANGVVDNSNSGFNVYHPQWINSGSGTGVVVSNGSGVKLDNSRVEARNSLVALTKAGVPADSDFTTAGNTPNGTLAVDTTNNKLYARIGGTWKGVTVT